MEPDEGRYAEIPREMLEMGDYLTPHLNYVHYFEKPPLLYWLNALSMKLFGMNEWAVRLPTALSAVCTILFVYYLGRQLFGRRSGLYAALVLGSCMAFGIQGGIVTTDILLTLCLTVALGCFIMAVAGKARRPAHLILFYIFAGLAVLTKGLIGLLFPVAIIGLFICLTRRWNVLKEMHLLSGLCIMLLVSAPWFVLVSLKHPEFMYFFFVHEHFERFLTTIHHRNQPFWFFVPVLLAGMLPWSVMIPTAVCRAWRQKAGNAGASRLYLVLWLVFIFLFFSISKSKLIPYILSLYPAAALLIGEMLSESVERMTAGVCLNLKIMGSVLLLTGIVSCLAPAYAPDQVLSVFTGVLIGLLLFTQGVVVFWCGTQKDTTWLFPGTLITFLLVMTAGVPTVLERVAAIRSLKPLGEQIRLLASPDTVVVSQGLRQGLSFYARQRIVILENPGEIAFGFKHGSHDQWLINRKQFYDLWDSGRTVLAVVRFDDIQQLEAATTVKHRLLLDNGKFKLISNRP